MPWRGREETCEHARLAREWCARSTIQCCCQRVRHIVNYLSCKIVITAIAATLVLTLPAGVVTLHSACDPYGGWLPSRPCLSDAARPSRAPPPLSGGPCASDGRAGAGAHRLWLCKMPPLRAQLSRPAGWAQLEPEVQVDTLSPAQAAAGSTGCDSWSHVRAYPHTRRVPEGAANDIFYHFGQALRAA